MQFSRKKIVPILVLVFIAWLVWNDQERGSGRDLSGAGDDVLATAFENRRSNLQVEGEGVIVKMLPDDNDGSRHQQFILKLRSGQTLKVAHNIDVAPRIDALAEGDTIQFAGEYEWNPQGGVIHWTHHDPRGRHAPGWLVHDGNRYD